MASSELERASRAERASAEEIRHTTLNALLWLSFALSSLTWWLQAVGSDVVTVAQWLSVISTIFLLLDMAVAQPNPRLSAWLFVGYVFLLSLACLVWVDPGPAPLLLAGSALAAGMLIGPRAAPLVGILSATILHFSGRADLSEPALVLTISVGAWLALRPLYDLLHRYSRQTLDAVSMAEQLRDERGKLGQTIKDLDLSYRLLAKTNMELALVCREADLLRDLRHRFATNLSHELRTPLNVILGFSRLIYSNPDLYGFGAWPDSLRRDLAEMQRNAGYLSRLVDDIVDLARADALALPLQREPCDLSTLAQEAVDLVHSMARHKGLQVMMVAQARPRQVLADPVRVRQILFNLLTNAIRHTDRGEVVVRLTETADEAVVSVSDTGCGIPESEISTIFNEFYQIGRPKVDGDSGKGLGLAISKRLVQLHGGRIWAESQVGVGSTFSFSLPSGCKLVSLGRRSSPVLVSSAAPAVLLVNDDGTAGSYLRRRLEGYDFVSIGDVSDLQPVVEANRPVAVILSTGSDAGAESGTESLLECLPAEMPVIRCALPSATWLSHRGDFQAVLTKPVTQESLLAAIEQAGINGSASRILVVDDDRGFVQLLKRMIESAPGGPRHEVVGAYSGQEALRKARLLRPQLLLLDLVLPDTSGFEVAGRLREDYGPEAAKVIAVTAATPGEDQLEARGASFLMRRRGPFRPGELAYLIAAGLACATGKLNLPADTA